MINSTVSKTSYDAQSGVLEYPIGFQYMTNGLTGAPELKVKVDGLEAEFGVDFNVTSDKGHISFFVEPAVGAKIEIIRTTSRLQESDYQYGRINPQQIEKDFDRLTMRDQELTQSDEDIGARIDASVAEIAAEITAAKARISANEGNISWLDGKASELEGAISEEAENRAHDDGILLEKIEQLNERNEDYREEAQNAVAAEATARAEADTNLQGAIAAEANARSTADTNLQNLISNTNGTVATLGRAVQDVDAKVDTKQDKLVAGANIKIEGNEISADVNDSLPTAGGTMSGPIEFTGSLDSYLEKLPVFRFNVTGGGYTTNKTIEVGPLNTLFLNELSLSGVGDIAPFGPSKTLGLNVSKWDTVYVTKIYNGGTIDIPAKAGTMALTSDIDEAVGDISTVLTAIIGE